MMSSNCTEMQGISYLARSLSPGDGSQHNQWFLSQRDGFRQWRVRRFMREVFLAGKEPEERPSLVCHLIANGATQHRIAGLERVDGRANCGRPLDLDTDFAADTCQRSQVRRQLDSDQRRHRSVWTSTESTAGRSRTMEFQLSPASAEQYTCPPVVPKYTPHSSSESTDIASRSTFT